MPLFCPHFKKMQIVQNHQTDITGQHAVQHPPSELGGGPPRLSGVAEELQHGPVEILHSGIPGQPDPADGDPLVPLARERARLLDLPLMEVPGEGKHRGRLAQPRERVDGHSPLGLVPVLLVTVDDVP
ncbi:hypothetical protein GCM10015535_50960 [Streptomyces gelaticus]|uniref:Uncharacterized protein n=1 Tax=Streptomyces gelaticus TaxID=285446 RepID=A0ABQ2W417_9ACTN|nr:hypothetical protein GCM10015535_50960 [Streptomyces gelaticus]